MVEPGDSFDLSVLEAEILVASIRWAGTHTYSFLSFTAEL